MDIEHDARVSVLPPAQLGPGSVVGGRYRILCSIGQGGMGAVFEAENMRTLKRVAVKWLHPRLVPNVLAQERLLREARATSRIRHRNVVDLYDVVVDGEAVVLVMELLRGQPLAARLSSGATSLVEVVRWLVAAMEGLAAAHAIGIIHRDIKPENIFLAESAKGAEPVPKLIDFGICKTFEPEVADLTQSGMAIGTPRYISFEQLRGDRSVDARCDVYALGVILYEALLGRPPYRARSLGEQAVQFVTYDPPAPSALRPELPQALSCAVVKAIARDRELRFDNVGQLLAALRPFCDDAAWPSKMMVWEGPALLPEGAAGGDVPTAPAPNRPTALATQPRREPRGVPTRSRARAVLAVFASIFVLAACVALTRRLGADVKAPMQALHPVATAHASRPAPAPQVSPTPLGPSIAHGTNDEPLSRGEPDLATTTVSVERAEARTKAPAADAHEPKRRAHKKPKKDLPAALDTTPPVAASQPEQADRAPANEGTQPPEVGEEGSHRAGRLTRREF